MSPDRLSWRLVLLASAAVAWPGLTLAQTSPEAAPARATANREIYDETFFARYQPNNAEDILRRIPGVPAMLDTTTTANQPQQRGFGSGGAQILLNGRRFPGKANEITTTLRRISADGVARVELISGAADDIKIQSQGLIVNVVLRPGAAIKASGSWEANARFDDEDFFNVDGLASYNGSIGALSYGAGIERNVWSPPTGGGARYSERTRDEVYRYPNGAVQELRPQKWSRSHDKWILTGNLTYDFDDGARATLNGLFQTIDIIETDVTPFVRFSPTGQETLRATELHSRDNDGFSVIELGGEYLKSIGPGSFTGLFIFRRLSQPTVDFRNVQEPTRLVEVSRSASDVDTGEDIVRGAYQFPAWSGASLEVGGELARNTLKQQLDVFFDFNRDGVLEPVANSINNPKVKELRGEAFARMSWRPTPQLSADAALNYEYSKLTTNYPLQPTRKLSFLKPRLDLRYRAGSYGQARVLIERNVSQLDFNNFVPRYNVTDDTLESGNPGLEPQKTWKVEAGYEYRLPKDGGRVELRAAYEDITDAIDRYPFCRTPRGLEAVDLCRAGAANPGREPRRFDSAFGNIPSASRYTAEAKASIRLGAVGLPDAVLSLRGLRTWSDVRDPFTGEDRRLNDDRRYAYDIGFRHDLTAAKMSYGVDYRSIGVAGINSDLLFTEYFEIDPTLEVFVERRLNRQLTLRFEAQNLTHSHERRSRYLYATNVFDGTLRRVDYFEERRDIRAAVRLRGRF